MGTSLMPEVYRLGIIERRIFYRTVLSVQKIRGMSGVGNRLQFRELSEPSDVYSANFCIPILDTI